MLDQPSYHVPAILRAPFVTVGTCFSPSPTVTWSAQHSYHAGTVDQALPWRLIAQRLMHALRLVPDAVERPPDLALGQRRVLASVDLLGLVVAGNSEIQGHHTNCALPPTVAPLSTRMRMKCVLCPPIAQLPWCLAPSWQSPCLLRPKSLSHCCVWA